MQSKIGGGGGGLPPAFSLFPSLNKTFTFHQILVLIITFLGYASFHASRKPPSIVKSVLGPSVNEQSNSPIDNGWVPFNGTEGTQRLGELDLAFLSSYALGHLGDRIDLRLFLVFGMMGSGILTVVFGLGYWMNVHLLGFYMTVQIVCGLFQSIGWPCVVSVLVAYTFLYWLPYYLRHQAVAGVYISHKTAGILSTVFDIGGVFGGISAGFISDKIKARALTSIAFLSLSIPVLIMYRVYGSVSMFINIGLMFISGLLVNGPYALITTAVAADLGTQDSIKGNGRALATVTAIIDGTGSVGAALGPLLAGYISSRGWNSVFFMLIVSIFFAGLFLVRLAKAEIKEMSSSGELIASSGP
ncbi:hypothetical protein BRARA_G00291 [Brassica rapa]|uniref:Major facilitator superfamily (MFS) profile domain-containing protein n=1 Tax=Brassica campestris TaxID=3711 RepID=A0A397YPX8_BRACM|nr:hypothetical protein BRARA_G00291 [Brassica rapa]